jgi:hypothetical protein
MTTKRPARIVAGVAASLALVWFYRGYVPLAQSFQAVLLPLSIGLFITTMIDRRTGLALFIFLFPVVNSLPYLFRIREDIPHAPTALVLCLFFLLGWVWGKASRPGPPRGRPEFFRPLGYFSLLVAGSALVAIWRYANHYPILSGRFLELRTNVEGTTAGGAVQSALFFALSYLTAAAFIYVFLETADRDFVLRTLPPLLAGAVLVSLGAAFVQRFVDIGWGNNLRGIRQGLVNATFKDSIACGVFLAMAVPLLLGAAQAASPRRRPLYLAPAVLAAAVILLAGARGGLAGLVVGLALSGGRAILRFRPSSGSGRSDVSGSKVAAAVALIMLAALLVLAAVRRPAPQLLTLTRWRSLWAQSTTQFASSPRAKLWRAAAAMMKDYPLTGVGVGGFVIEASNFAKLRSIPGVIAQSAENYALQAGAELGWPGLLLLLWLAAEIGREVFGRRARAPAPDDSGIRHLRSGALIGLVAFLVNTPFHSFIGSYEIKYLAWLLLGVAVVLSPSRQPEEPTRFPGWARATVIGLLALHTAASAWNALHSLSLEKRSEALGLRQEFGFFPEERTPDGRAFRWSGRLAGGEIPPPGTVLRLPLKSSHPDIFRRPLDVRVYLSDRFFRSWEPAGSLHLADDRPHIFELSLDERAARKRYIMLDVGRTWSPLEESGIADSRRLGVAVAGDFFVRGEDRR